MPSAAWTDRTPGAWLLRPVALGGVSMLIVNDRILKPAFDSWWTGKLSDFAGMIVFPLFCCAAYEWMRWAVGAAPTSLKSLASWTCILTGLLFSAINVSTIAAAAYSDFLWMTWRASPSFLSTFVPSHTLDPTDLIALPMLIVPWRLVVGSQEHGNSPTTLRPLGFGDSGRK